jgi:hypothetical protein
VQGPHQDKGQGSRRTSSTTRDDAPPTSDELGTEDEHVAMQGPLYSISETKGFSLGLIKTLSMNPM